MRTVSIILASLLLAACASNGEIRRAPSYATMLDTQSYQVLCPNLGVREIYVRFDNVDAFYHADGREMTREEFCSQSHAGARRPD